MSCDGWSVGEKCRARVAFMVREKQMNGPDVVTHIDAGDEGNVRQKISNMHMLYVFWTRLQKSLPTTHEQVHLLDKIR